MNRTSMRRGAGARLLLVAAMVVAGPQAVAAADDDPPRTLQSALQSYERNHWPEAYAAFARLADEGQPEAARVALQMWTWGPRLYGQRFEASERQLRQWREQRREVAAAEGAR